MKTTIDIASNILAWSREVARRENITLRELVEEGLVLVLAHHQRRRRTPVKPVTFRGRGLTAWFRHAKWERIRDAAYESRGA